MPANGPQGTRNFALRSVPVGGTGAGRGLPGACDNRRLIGSPELRARLGENGPRMAVESFQLDCQGREFH